MNGPTARRSLAGIIALSLTLSISLGTEAAGPKQAGMTLPRYGPTMTGKGSPLTAAQILRLARDAESHVIIVLKDQASAFDGRAREMLATRAGVIAQFQRPVLHELRQVHARNVMAFHIIDAIRATISQAEATRLRSNPAVEAVVPDTRLRMGPVVEPTDLPRVKREVRRAASISCPGGGTTYLEPQALEDTHTAFLNGGTPQAQNYATGAGVTVAIISGPIDPFNPDFIRPDGTPVITDYENFSGEPYGTPASGGSDLESFLDMSSVASQGNEVFNLNDYGYTIGNDCRHIRILGMAPGANVMWLNAGDEGFVGTSAALLSIQYAVDNGANVISMSFGSNFNSDTGVDPLSMASEQATQDGVTVVISAGDAGPGGSIGSPASARDVIAAGASTTEDFRLLINELADLGVNRVLNDNVSSFSSSGVTQSGQKTVDVLAPGAFGFIDCDANPIQFPGCTNEVGLPSPFTVEGGTSESAPLTAGEAALVIQAYADAHKALPSAAQVKQIITGTANDLHDPSVEQGAGLIDSLRAVEAARSWGVTTGAIGDALVTSPTALAARGFPGDALNLPFTVTNAGTHSEIVTPAGRMLGSPVWTKSTTVQAPATSGPAQATVKFTLPKGVDHLSGDISWDVVKQPFGMVEMRLIDPLGRYADNTQPSDVGPPYTSSGFGHIDIARPAAGLWTAEIHTLSTGTSVPTYTGPVHINLTGSNFVRFGSVSPASQAIAPGRSATFRLHASYPRQAGDFTADLAVSGKANGSSVGAGTLPVILRTMVSLSKNGGTFAGSFGGGNGRPGALYSHTYEFSVPMGERDLDLGVKLNASHSNIDGVLINPAGYAMDNQSTVTNLDMDLSHVTFGQPNAYTNTLQFFRLHPRAGVWRLVLLVNDNISGASTSIGFTGTIAFNTVSVSASGLPAGASTMLAAGSPLTVSVRIKNTGNTSESYFVDPRLTTQAGYVEGEQIKLAPPFLELATFLAPPETSQLVLAAESIGTSSLPSVPILFDSQNFDGPPPYAFGSDPDLEAQPTFNVATSDFGAEVTFSAPEVPAGLYDMAPAEVGPFPLSGVPTTVADLGALIVTQEFDPNAVSSTGDPWAVFFGASGDYRPLKLKPGQSGTIHVIITPSAPSGTSVSGTLYVDTLAATKGFPTASPSNAITWSGDEVAALPYAYTVK